MRLPPEHSTDAPPRPILGPAARTIATQAPIAAPTDGRPPAGVPMWTPPALAIAALGYAAWLLAYVLKVNVGTVDGYVSELSAADEPFRWVFATGDCMAGSLAVLAAVGLLSSGRLPGDLRTGGGLATRPTRSRHLTAAAWIALALFGVFTVADVVFPLDCAPSVNAACRAAEGAGAISTAARVHVYTSVLSNAAILVHMSLVVWIARRAPERWPVLGRARGRAADGVAGGAVLSTLVVLAMVPFGDAVGIPQRVSVLCISLWLALLAGDLAERRRWR